MLHHRHSNTESFCYKSDLMYTIGLIIEFPSITRCSLYKLKIIKLIHLTIHYLRGIEFSDYLKKTIYSDDEVTIYETALFFVVVILELHQMMVRNRFYQWLCTHNSLLVVLGGPYRISEIRMVTCKANTVVLCSIS